MSKSDNPAKYPIQEIVSDSGLIDSTVSTDCTHEILYSGNHAKVAFHHMEEFFMKGLFFDVTLVIGAKHIDAHRVVLCAMSEYFRTMFTSFIEVKKDVIEMNDVDPEALATVVRSFYSGNIKLSMETVDAILATAHYLLLTEIVDTCCNFLMKHLNTSNSLSIQTLANRFGCSSLIQATTGYIEDNFLEITKNQEFLNIPKSNIKGLLSSDSIKVSSEEHVFQALVVWLNYDLEFREKYITELLALIKLPNLSPEFLIDHIKVHPLIKDNISCQDIIMEAMVCHLIPNKLSNFRTAWTTRRKSSIEGFYIMGGKHSLKESAITVEKYDFSSNSWSSVSVMSKKSLFGMTVLNNKIYVMGGTSKHHSTSFKCYDPEENLWTCLSPMQTARSNLGAATLNSDIYAIGGYNGTHSLDTVERWNSATQKWDSTSLMVSPRKHCGVAVLNERLYAVGGERQEEVECYDPYNSQWTLVSDFNVGCKGMAVVAAKGFLYVIGGMPHEPFRRKYDTIERYDPVTKIWTELKPLLVGCAYASVGLFHDKIFLAGGVDEESNYLNVMQCYNIQLDEWKFMAPLSVSRARGAGTVISQ